VATCKLVPWRHRLLANLWLPLLSIGGGFGCRFGQLLHARKSGQRTQAVCRRRAIGASPPQITRTSGSARSKVPPMVQERNFGEAIVEHGFQAVALARFVESTSPRPAHCGDSEPQNLVEKCDRQLIRVVTHGVNRFAAVIALCAHLESTGWHHSGNSDLSMPCPMPWESCLI